MPGRQLKTKGESADSEEKNLLNRKILLSDGPVSITREHVFSPEIIRFLDETTWGTSETLYEHQNTEQRLRHLKDPVLAVLRHGDGLLAMVIIERRRVRVGNQVLKGYFFRSLASKVRFRERRLVGKYARKLMSLIVDDEQEEAVFYASVEGKNYRSFNFLHKMGYSQQGTIATLGYSRWWPKGDSRLTRVERKDYAGLLEKLDEQHKGHTLVHFDYIMQNNDYFVLKENGEIVAGCQVHVAKWVVKNIPNRFGGLLLKVIPFIPFVRSVFNPKDFQFLTFEGLYVLPGREVELVRLFESLLHKFNLKASLVWLDITDPLYPKLKNIGLHGVMKNFVDNASVRIMAISRKMSKPTRKHIAENPIYLSTIDFI
ncbi:MAG: hypothetical protein HKN76_04280 [Saprospiraceae bacterium]|nr:hypothetical protein [Saprospiraceae bacterium]